MKTFVFGVTVVAIFGAVSARDLPEFIHVCKKNDPNLGVCIKNSVDNFKPHLKAGLPEYNIPSMEPLSLKEIAASAGGIKLKLTNIKVHDASNFLLERVKANLDKLKFIIYLDLPKLQIVSDYEIDGKILLLQLRGDGPLDGNFTNCKAIVKLQMGLSKGADGNNYLNVADLQTKFSVAGGKLKLQNLFGGDPVLGDAVNVAINSNFDAFLVEITPALESGISTTFTQIANQVLEQFTYETLFPQS